MDRIAHSFRAFARFPYVLAVSVCLLATACPNGDSDDTFKLHLVNSCMSGAAIDQLWLINNSTGEFENLLTQPLPADTMLVLPLSSETYGNPQGDVRIVITGAFDQTIIRVPLGPEPLGFTVYQCNDIAFTARTFEVDDRTD